MSKTISQLFSDNPQTTLPDTTLFEVAGDFGSGVASGAIAFSALTTLFRVQPTLPISGSTGSFTTLGVSGNVTLGNTTATSTATPLVINSGGTYASSAVATKVKWRLYDDGNDAHICGIGLSTGHFNFHTFSSIRYSWLFDDVEKFGIADNGAVTIAGQATITSPAANTLALRNSTTGQTFLLSRSYTDGSNYSQLKIDVTGSVVAFTADEVGTGVGTLVNYTFDKPVLAPNIPVADTGWVANADTGSKTVVIQPRQTAAISFVINALDPTGLNGVADLFNYLADAAEKVKALQEAGRALVAPNA